MVKDHYSKHKGAWGFKCGYCGYEYSYGAGGCDACRVCAKCNKFGGCYNKIYEYKEEPIVEEYKGMLIARNRREETEALLEAIKSGDKELFQSLLDRILELDEKEFRWRIEKDLSAEQTSCSKAAAEGS